MSMSMSMRVREEVLKSLVSVVEGTNRSVIERCALHYKFDAEEALRMLGMVSVSVSVMGKKEKKEKKHNTPVPMPYNGECSDSCCQALRQNNGLYTQCLLSRKGESEYCKSCQSSAEKSDSGTPEYGTIQQRIAADIFGYVDPKGRKPVAFAKVMKKYKLTEEQVLAEAEKFNININPIHFQKETEKIKRGRPASQKEPKEAKGAKGRPKKSKKVIQIEGESDDLFASLVANAQSEATGSEATKSEAEAEAEGEGEAEAEGEGEAEAEAEGEAEAEAVVLEEPVKKQKAPKKSDEEKAALALAKQEKQEALTLAKQEKEEKAALIKQEKEAKKQEKEAKKQEKESKKQEKEEKQAKPEKKVPPKEEEEADVVKKIEIDGKKYLKSKKSGIIYDYTEYTKNGDQVVVGQWNETKNKIDFSSTTNEESEEEYEEESEEEL